MGFDLYGLNPKINVEKSDRFNKIMELYGDEEHGEFLDWEKTIPDEITKEYFELKNKSEEDNPGFYFRNNVWWWRPLWEYVCNVCQFILDEEDMDNGHNNGGHEITGEKANTIANVLLELIESKDVQKYEVEYTSRLKSLPLETCQYCYGTGKRNDENVKGKCNVCNSQYRDESIPVGKVRNFDCSYPFSTDNVKRFAIFCKESGGFSIC